MTYFVSRRSFLAASAGVAGATWFDLLPAARAADEAAADEAAANSAANSPEYYGGLPIGIQSYTLRKFKTEDVIRHIQGLGLQYVEFFGAHFSPESSPEQIAAMKQTLAAAKIKLNAHGVHNFTKDHEANKKLFTFAKAAGIRNITANPQPDSFDSLDKLCEEFDIRIAIHNHGPGALYDGLETVTERVKDRHKLIGACVDTGHVLRSDEDPVKWVRELGPRVFALHVKDVAEKKDRTHDVIIGKGHLDVVGLFEAVRAVKFPADGTISMEYEANPDNPVDDVRACLEVAREAIAKAMG